jgi:hypothetical protein
MSDNHTRSILSTFSHQMSCVPAVTQYRMLCVHFSICTTVRCFTACFDRFHRVTFRSVIFVERTANLHSKTSQPYKLDVAERTDSRGWPQDVDTNKVVSTERVCLSVCHFKVTVSTPAANVRSQSCTQRRRTHKQTNKQHAIYITGCHFCNQYTE